MASNLFKRYIWLADTIHRYGPITLAEIRTRWQRSALYDGRPLARRTFHSHRDAVEELFDLSIVCDEHTNRYSIANSEDLNSHNITNWLLDSFAVGQSLREAHTLHNRVLVEEVPSARGHLPELLDAMRENRQVVVTYQPSRGTRPSTSVFGRFSSSSATGAGTSTPTSPTMRRPSSMHWTAW